VWDRSRHSLPLKDQTFEFRTFGWREIAIRLRGNRYFQDFTASRPLDIVDLYGQYMLAPASDFHMPVPAADIPRTLGALLIGGLFASLFVNSLPVASTV
jgi:hypothetical protein